MTDQPQLDRFELEGRTFDFDPGRNEVWILPPVRRWAPKPQPEPSLWQRMVQSVKGAML